MTDRRRRRYGGGLIAATLLAASPALAQSPPEALGPTLTSPYDISACLCLERDLPTRMNEIAVRRNAYEAMEREIRDAETAIERDRSRVDVNDPAAVDAFKRRLEALDALKARRDQVALPDYQGAVATYSERFNQYNQRCSGRGLDPAVTQQVRQNLICRME